MKLPNCDTITQVDKSQKNTSTKEEYAEASLYEWKLYEWFVRLYPLYPAALRRANKSYKKKIYNMHILPNWYLL